MTYTIALVAGEDSGDQLGAALISSLKTRYPDARFVGIGGERMRALGMDCWWDCSELAVFGLFEVLSHFRRIWRLRKDLMARIESIKPDVFIGIDAPDFNLGLERKLKAKGIRTVHYVSPTVWAWRAWRIPRIRKAADLVLCLFPFEPDFLAQHDINAAYVGHPMADQIDAVESNTAARASLGLGDEQPVFALLPGSRQGEVERLAEPMLEAAEALKAQYPEARFITALANDKAAAVFGAASSNHPTLQVNAFRGQVREVIAAADVVICASGTVTLEIMLVSRPMVVCYRLSPSTYYLARTTNLVKAKRFSLPNILAGEDLVPELIQDAANGAEIARQASGWIADEKRRGALKHRFERLHETLRCNAGERAAEAVAGLLEQR